MMTQALNRRARRMAATAGPSVKAGYEHFEGRRAAVSPEGHGNRSEPVAADGSAIERA